MNTQVQTALSTFESRLNSLVTTLTTTPTASGGPSAATNLLAADDSLTSTIDTLKQHQANYARILQLRAEAQSLQERVKDIVRLAIRYEKDIREVCGDDSDEDEEYDSEEEYETGTEGTMPRKRKEVDYKLLLDFARRISKYNHEAAANAAAGKTRQTRTIAGQGQDTEMGGTNMNGNLNADSTPDAEPVAAVTKDATSWLDESANMTRQVYMLPYPMEDRIRLGLMGQIQLTAAEGRPGFDPDQEVERLIREAEGVGIAEAAAPVPVGEDTKRVNEAARAAAHAGSAAAGAGVPAVPPKPKATLDLDLYDPDEDED
ncbi:vitamin-D-receptor interacting mediator subunit 4-domain-containing protein [Aspergillus oleicola]